MSAGKFTLNRVAVAAACTVLTLAPAASWALGLGKLNVQSALGESLRAEIDVTSLSAEEGSSLKVRVASTETYRAAGVDYNAVLTATQISLQRRSDGRPYLKISSERSVQEPFVDVILDLTWASGRLVREYTLLFDPPSAKTAAAVTTSPVIAAPVPPAPAAPAAAPAPAPAPVAAPAPAPVAAPAPAPVAQAKPAVEAKPKAKTKAELKAEKAAAAEAVEA